MLSAKRIISFLCALYIAAAFILTGCGDKEKVVKVDLQDKILCAAESVTIFDQKSSLTEVSIPPNSCITKIRASVLTDEEANDLDFVSLTIFSVKEGVGERIFSTLFPKDPNISVGAYETDFIHPVCVGPEGGFVSIATGFAIKADLELSVVYCPNYRTE